MATAYERGRNLEYLIMNKFKDAGYSVIRAAGSHTPVDVLAGLSGTVYAIQCKISTYIRPAELEKLKDYAYDLGAIPCYTEKEQGKWKVITLNDEVVL